MRLYITNATAPYNPGTRHGGWETLGTGNGTSHLTTTKAGAVARTGTNKAASTDGQPYDALNRTFVSDPFLSGGTVTGSLSAVLSVDESGASANYFARVYVWVSAGDSDTVRGVLVDAVSATEHAVGSSTPLAVAVSGALSSVAAQAGDRIVAEIGYRSTVGAATNTGALRYGGTDATDLVAGNTAPEATTRSGWVELPVDALFVASTPVSELTDNFDDGVVDTTTKWPDSFGGARLSETGGRARVDVTDGTGNGVSAGYGSAAEYTLADSEAFVQCQPPDLLPSAETCYGRLVYYANPSVSYNTYAAWHADRVFGMYSQVSVGGVIQDNTIVADYDPVAHRWIKLRETDGTLYFEASPSGRPGTWTTLRTWTTPTEIGTASTGEIAIEAGSDTTDATTNQAQFDSFNIEPPAPTAPAGQFMPFFT